MTEHGSGTEAHEPAASGDAYGPPDAEAVRRVRNGDREAFTILIRRYQARFHRFALGMVDDPDAATDLVQDSFVKAYGSLEACRNPEKFESWAYQILRNRCRDYLGNLRRTHRSLDDAPELVSSLGGPAADLERSRLRDRLRAALAALPGGHREAFLLKHLEGRTYPEIAEMLGVTRSAVKMRVHRSREMLRESLAEHPAPPSDVTIGDLRTSSSWNAAEASRRTGDEES